MGRANHVVLGETLLVQFGIWRVMLPGNALDIGWWDRLEQQRHLSLHRRFRDVTAVSFPTHPRHVSDFYGPKPANRDWRLVDFIGDGAPFAA